MLMSIIVYMIPSGTGNVLGLKLTQSSPFVMFESAIVTLSLRKMSQPSVFFASLDEVETAEMVMLQKTTFFPSLTYIQCNSFDRNDERSV